MKAIKYRGHDIEKDLGGYLVFFQGDEIFFDEEQDAKDFIDNVEDQR